MITKIKIQLCKNDKESASNYMAITIVKNIIVPNCRMNNNIVPTIDYEVLNAIFLSYFTDIFGVPCTAYDSTTGIVTLEGTDQELALIKEEWS